MYHLLADLVVVFHFTFVLFIIVGGLLVLRWPKLMWLHLACAAWGALVEFTGWICPLTPLENWLRSQAGIARYSGDFVARYVLAALYPSGLTRAVQIALGLMVVGLNLLIYLVVLPRSRARAKAPS